MQKDENLIGNMHHITDFLGNSYEFECLGCEIAQKRIIPPGGIIYEDDTFLLAIDPLIPLNGFLIITAKKHVNSITELSTEEQHRLIGLISKTTSILKELNITKEITIVQEERSKHLHIWIFPNQEWMIEKFGKGVSYLRDICEYAKQSVTDEEIQKILETINKIKAFF